MDNIVRCVRVTHHQVPPFDVPVHDSTMGPFDRFSPSVLRVCTSDGHEGIALTTPIEADIIRISLAPLLVGQQAASWQLVRQRAFWALRNLGIAGLAMNALSAVDIAVTDLQGRLDGTSLRSRFGSSCSRVETYGSGGWVSLSTSALVASMEELVHRGFTTLKMKIGIDGGRRPAQDVDRVRAVREAVGSDVRLGVDANQCWDAATAVRVARELTELDVAWFEEPVLAYDHQACAVFRSESPIPLACGESERLVVGFRDLIAREAADILQPQPMVCGGITGWREVAESAAGAGLPLNCGGCSYLTCQLLATAATPVICEYLVPFMDSLGRYFREAPRLAGHDFVFNETPGNGMVLDEEYLRTHPGSSGWERTE